MKKLNRELWLKDVRETERKIREIKSWIRQPQKPVPLSDWPLSRKTNAVTVEGETKKVYHLQYELFKLQATVTALYTIRRMAKGKHHPVDRCWAWQTHELYTGGTSHPYICFIHPRAGAHPYRDLLYTGVRLAVEPKSAVDWILKGFDVSKYFVEVPDEH